MTLEEWKSAIHAQPYPRERAAILARYVVENYKPGERVRRAELSADLDVGAGVTSPMFMKLKELGYLVRGAHSALYRTNKTELLRA